MSKNFVRIVTDLDKFIDRYDEITGETSYDSILHAVAKIKDALYDNPDIPALCAPQVDEPYRLFVVRTARTEAERFKVFLNPLIISGEGLHLSREVNASLPGKQFIIPRKDKIHVAYQTSDGHVDSQTFIGTYGEVVQQMIEMLDGITLDTYGLDLDMLADEETNKPGYQVFDEATEEERTEVCSMYLSNLKEQSGELQTEIENNPDLKLINDTIRFRTGMLTGDIKPIDDQGNVVDEEYIKKLAKEKADKIIEESKAN